MQVLHTMILCYSSCFESGLQGKEDQKGEEKEEEVGGGVASFPLIVSHFCIGLGCNATIAPVGYVGNCPAGPSCATNVSCAPGYFPKPGHFSAFASCWMEGGSFHYSGCGMPACVLVPFWVCMWAGGIPLPQCRRVLDGRAAPAAGRCPRASGGAPSWKSKRTEEREGRRRHERGGGHTPSSQPHSSQPREPAGKAGKAKRIAGVLLTPCPSVSLALVLVVSTTLSYKVF